MVSILSRPLDGHVLLMHGCLRRAVAEYGTNRSAPRIIREMLAERPNLFIPAALHLLHTTPAGPGRDFVATLLLETPEALRSVTDPSRISRDETVTLIRHFMESDHLVDVRLARKLPGRDGNLRELGLPASIRVLDALDEVSPGGRLVPVLGYLANFPDPQLSGKAIKLVARRLTNPDWVQRHMDTPDARTRANLVEALWDVRAPYVRNTFLEALRDPHHRVRGNAILGLHQLQEPGIQETVLRMARDPRGSFRRTAAWVMGRMGDPELADPLRRLTHDRNADVRGTALRSLARLRRSEEAGTAAQLQRLAELTAPEPVEAPAPEPAELAPPRSNRRFQTLG